LCSVLELVETRRGNTILNKTDDPRKPVLIIGYSTEAQVRPAISSGRPSDPETAVR